MQAELKYCLPITRNSYSRKWVFEQLLECRDNVNILPLSPNLTEPHTGKQDLVYTSVVSSWLIRALLTICVSTLIVQIYPFSVQSFCKKKKKSHFLLTYWPESSEVVCSCWLIKATKLTTPTSVIKCVKLTNENNRERYFFFSSHVVTSICIK